MKIRTTKRLALQTLSEQEAIVGGRVPGAGDEEDCWKGCSWLVVCFEGGGCYYILASIHPSRRLTFCFATVISLVPLNSTSACKLRTASTVGYCMQATTSAKIANK